MKRNAPDKIYLHIRANNEIGSTWHGDKITNKDIEYTRTDALIEKACEVDLDKQAEWIANGIMIAIQSAKLHTNVYNPDRKDYDHSHLMQAARRGIELGLKISKKREEV